MLSDLSKLFTKVGGKWRYIILLLFRCPTDCTRTFILAVFLERGFAAISEQNEQKLIQSCIWFAIANALIFLYNGTVWTAYVTFFSKFAGRFHQLVFHYILHMPYEQVAEKSTGEWMLRFNSDTKMTLGLLSDVYNFPHLVNGFFNMTISFAFLVTYDTTLSVVSLIFLLTHMILNEAVINKPLKHLKEEAQTKTAVNLTYFSSYITCADTIRLYDAKEMIESKYEESSLAIMKVNQRIHIREAVSAAANRIFGLGGYVTLLFIGCTYLLNHRMSFGTLTAALQFRGGMLAATRLFLISAACMRMNAVGLKRMEEVYGGTIKDR